MALTKKRKLAEAKISQNFEHQKEIEKKKVDKNKDDLQNIRNRGQSKEKGFDR